MTARRAAIDIGTNSVKLLVADVNRSQISQVVFDSQFTTGLGEGSGATGRLSERAMKRTASEVSRVADKARQLGAKHIRTAGTAALRNTYTTNAGDFLKKVKDGARLDVRILSAAEELELANQATLATFSSYSPLVIVDIGGGSTELTIAVDGAVWESYSFEMGARTLSDVFSAAPTGAKGSFAALIPALWDELAELAVSELWQAIRESGSTLLVAQGGTAYSAARLSAGAGRTDPHGEVVSLVWLSELLSLTADLEPYELSELLSFDTARAPVFRAGLTLLQYFCAVFGLQDFLFSGFSLRHGMVMAERW